MTVQELSAALANPNIAAFLRVIREGESNQSDASYTLINGGAHFTDPSRHPYAGMRSPPGRASGAYQFLASTWGDVAARIGATDFGPGWQDLGAVDLLRYRGALDDVIAGRFDAACVKCRAEWTSLPGASESNQTLAKARAVYEKWGGRFAPVATPAAAIVNPIDNQAPPQPEKPMLPILALIAQFGPIIASLIPQVAAIVQPKGEVAQRNVALAQAVFDTVTKVADAASPAEAVSKMLDPVNGPALVQQVTQAVVTHPDVLPYLNTDGVPAARVADVAATQAEKPFWYSPNIWVALFLYFLIAYTLVMVLGGSADVAQDTKALVIGFIFGTGFASLVAYYFGTTQQSGQKDATIAKVATTP